MFSAIFAAWHGFPAIRVYGSLVRCENPPYLAKGSISRTGKTLRSLKYCPKDRNSVQQSHRIRRGFRSAGSLRQTSVW